MEGVAFWTSYFWRNRKSTEWPQNDIKQGQKYHIYIITPGSQISLSFALRFAISQDVISHISISQNFKKFKFQDPRCNFFVDSRNLYKRFDNSLFRKIASAPNDSKMALNAIRSKVLTTQIFFQYFWVLNFTTCTFPSTKPPFSRYLVSSYGAMARLG